MKKITVIILVFMIGLLIGCSHDKSLTLHQKKLIIDNALWFFFPNCIASDFQGRDSDSQIEEQFRVWELQARKELEAFPDEQLEKMGEWTSYTWYSKGAFERDLAKGKIICLSSGWLITFGKEPKGAVLPHGVAFAARTVYLKEVKMFAINWEWAKTESPKQVRERLGAFGASLEEVNKIWANWKKGQ